MMPLSPRRMKRPQRITRRGLSYHIPAFASNSAECTTTPRAAQLHPRPGVDRIDPFRRLLVLLDRRQTRWALVTAAVGVVAGGLYLWLDSRSPNPLTGGTTIGLWYGVAGSALMIYAGLLSAHRLFPATWWLGPRKTWLRGHIWLGSLSVVLIACHAHGRLGTGVAL